jgi:hypothetical protein
MASLPLPQLIVRAVLVLLLAVNGVAPALAASAMHQAKAPAAPASNHGMPMSVDADCHEDAAASAASAGEQDSCCPQEDDCALAGCECACLVVAATLPPPNPYAPAFVPAARPERLVPHAHAPPPDVAVIRPPIA